MEGRQESNSMTPNQDPNFYMYEGQQWSEHLDASDLAFLESMPCLKPNIDDHRGQLKQIIGPGFQKSDMSLNRIRNIIRNNRESVQISKEVPVIFSKALELFIVELTHKSWENVIQEDRNTLFRRDLIDCIQKEDMFDFVRDKV